MKFSRKNLGRVATTLLATAMLTAFTAVPASAETVTIGQNGTGASTGADGITSITFTNAVILPENVPVPSQGMTFQLKSTTGGNTVTDSNNHTIATETNSGTYTGTIIFNSTNATKDETYSVAGLDRYTQNVTISLDSLTFTEPGVYAYQLSETTSFPGSDWQHDDAMYVYLYVTRDNGAVKITGVSTSSTAGDVDKDTAKLDTMTNYYQVTKPDDPSKDPVVKANKITISNTIDGAMGDHSDPYTFTVEITANAATPNKAYTAIYVDQAGAAIPGKDSIPLTSDVENTSISLKHGEYLQINGLSQGDSFTITENEAGDNNYTTSIKKIINSVETPISGGTVTDTFGVNDVKLAFTNTRNSITPTGVVVSVAPYVLLVLVAAAAGFVFLRKRRED